MTNNKCLLNLGQIPHDIGCFVSSVASVLLHKQCAATGHDFLDASNEVYMKFYNSLCLTNIDPIADFNTMTRFVRQNPQLNIVIDVYCIYRGAIYPSYLGIGLKRNGQGGGDSGNDDNDIVVDPLAETSRVHTSRKRVPLLAIELRPDTTNSLFCAPGQHLLGIR